MMEGADILSISRAGHARSVNRLGVPENGENPENGETLKTVETVRTTKTLKHAPAASSCETLKQALPPASRGDVEAVKHTPERPCQITLRRAHETVKQPRKMQSGEDVTCFTPRVPASPPETVPRRGGAAREALKLPSVPVSGGARRGTREILETVKTLKTVKTSRTGTVGRPGRALAHAPAAGFGPACRMARKARHPGCREHNQTTKRMSVGRSLKTRPWPLFALAKVIIYQPRVSPALAGSRPL